MLMLNSELKVFLFKLGHPQSIIILILLCGSFKLIVDRLQIIDFRVLKHQFLIRIGQLNRNVLQLFIELSVRVRYLFTHLVHFLVQVCVDIIQGVEIALQSVVVLDQVIDLNLFVLNFCLQVLDVRVGLLFVLLRCLY